MGAMRTQFLTLYSLPRPAFYLSCQAQREICFSFDNKKPPLKLFRADPKRNQISRHHVVGRDDADDFGDFAIR